MYKVKRETADNKWELVSEHKSKDDAFVAAEKLNGKHHGRAFIRVLDDNDDHVCYFGMSKRYKDQLADFTIPLHFDERDLMERARRVVPKHEIESWLRNRIENVFRNELGYADWYHKLSVKEMKEEGIFCCPD